MISGFVRNGSVNKGLEMLDLMESSDLDIGANSWNSMIDGCIRLSGVQLAIEVFAYMVPSSVIPDSATFNTLLPIIPDVESLERLRDLHEFATRNLIVLDPGHSGCWVLLSNIYVDTSRWSDVSSIRSAMKDGGVKKNLGHSWIEVGGSEVHRFLTADKLHKQCDDIYFVLDGLTAQLKDEGYVPILDSQLT